MKSKQTLEGNMWIKQIELEHIGDEFPNHCHTFSHQHILAIGEVDICIDGTGCTRYKAPAILTIPAGQEHTMIAVTDKTLGFCLHAVKDLEGEIVHPDDLPENFTSDRFMMNKDYANLIAPKGE